jgi:hypothetical protein
MSEDTTRRARKVPGKKLLIASLGVAAVSYACAEAKRPVVTGNLVAPVEIPDASPRVADAGAEKPKPNDDTLTSGNLMAPMPTDAGPPKPQRPPEIVGNLMAPPPPMPPDAGKAPTPKPKK